MELDALSMNLSAYVQLVVFVRTPPSDLRAQSRRCRGVRVGPDTIKHESQRGNEIKNVKQNKYAKYNQNRITSLFP